MSPALPPPSTKLVIPAALISILGFSIKGKIEDGIYGSDMTLDFASALPWIAFLVWLGGTTILALILTNKKGVEPAEEEVSHA